MVMAVALGFGNLLALVVQEQFEHELFRRLAARDPADRVVKRRLGKVVLAVHFIVHIERGPAHAEIRFPLQLAMAPGDWNGLERTILLDIGDGALADIMLHHFGQQHLARPGTDGKEGRIGLLPLFAQGGQHHIHHLIVMGEKPQQRRVEHPPTYRSRWSF